MQDAPRFVPDPIDVDPSGQACGCPRGCPVDEVFGELNPDDDILGREVPRKGHPELKAGDELGHDR